MKRAIRNIILLLVLMVPIFVWAQPKSDDEEDVKKYADELFQEEKYVEATQYYLRLLSIHPRDYDYNYRYGTCLLYNSSDKEDAFKYLKFAIQSPGMSTNAYFFLGKAYHLNYKFNQAIQYYNTFLQKGDKKEVEKFQVEQQIKMCQNGKKLLNDFNDLIVMSKRPVKKEDFFRLYDLQNIDGTLLVTEDFQTKEDEKQGQVPLIFFPSQPSKIFYASYGDGGDNLDIYMKKKLPTGGWAKEQIVMGGVNTALDENYPFFHEATGYLYFSSKGHNSMGGYDVFRSRYNPDANTFEAPENVDFAISSPDDDLFYIVDKNNKFAYFASSRESESGQIHVYQVRIERFPAQLAVIKGTFSNAIAPNSKACKIKVVDPRTDAEIGTFNTNKKTGDYLLTFPKSGKYKFFVEAESSEIIHTSVIEIPYLKELRPLKQEMELVQKDGNEQLVIRNKFDELFDNPDAIMAEVMKQKSMLQPNADDYDLDSLDRLRKVNQILEDIGLPITMTNEDIIKSIDEQLAHTSEKLDEQLKNGVYLEKYALTQDSIARAKKKQAEQLLVEANNASDDIQRNKYTNQAKKLLAEAVDANEKSIVAAKAHEQLIGEVDSLSTIKNNLTVLKMSTNGKEEDRKALLQTLSDNKATASTLSNPLNNKSNVLDKMVSNSRKNAEALSKQKDYIAELTRTKNNIETEIKSLKNKLENTKKKKDREEIEDDIRKKEQEILALENEISKVNERVDNDSDNMISKHINEIVNDVMDQSRSIELAEDQKLDPALLSKMDQSFKGEVDNMKVDINVAEENQNVAENKEWSIEDYRVDVEEINDIKDIKAELRKQKYLESIAQTEEEKKQIAENIEALEEKKASLGNVGDDSKEEIAKTIQDEYQTQKENIEQSDASKEEKEKQTNALKETMKDALEDELTNASEEEKEKIQNAIDEIENQDSKSAAPYLTEDWSNKTGEQILDELGVKDANPTKQFDKINEAINEINSSEQSNSETAQNNLRALERIRDELVEESDYQTITFTADVDFKKLEGFFKGGLTISALNSDRGILNIANTNETGRVIFKNVKNDGGVLYFKIKNADNYESSELKFYIVDENGNKSVELKEIQKHLFMLDPNSIDQKLLTYKGQNNIASTNNNTSNNASDETYDSELLEIDISANTNDEVLEKINADNKTPQEQLDAINKTKAALESSKNSDNADVVENNIAKLDEVANDIAQENNIASTNNNNTSNNNTSDETFDSELLEIDISANTNDEVLEKINANNKTPQEQLDAINKTKAALESSKNSDNADVVENNIAKLDEVANDIAQENNIASTNNNNTSNNNTSNNTSNETYNAELLEIDISANTNDEVLEKINADNKTPQEQLDVINKTKAALESSKNSDNADVVENNISKLDEVANDIAQENNIASTNNNTSNNNSSDETYNAELLEIDISANTNDEVLEKINADNKTPQEQLDAINKTKAALESSKNSDNADVVENNIAKLDEVANDIAQENNIASTNNNNTSNNNTSNNTSNETYNAELLEIDISANTNDEVLEKINADNKTPQEQLDAINKTKAALESSKNSDNADVVENNIAKLDEVANDIAQENNIASTNNNNASNNNSSDETYNAELLEIDISANTNEEVLGKINADNKTPQEQVDAIEKTKAALESAKNSDNEDIVNGNIVKLDEVANAIANENNIASNNNNSSNNTSDETFDSELLEIDISVNTNEEVLEKINADNKTPQEQLDAIEKTKVALESSKNNDNEDIVNSNIAKLDEVANAIANENNIASNNNNSSNNTSDETFDSELLEIDISANTNDEVLEKINANNKTPQEQLDAINKTKAALESAKNSENEDIVNGNIAKLNQVGNDIANENNTASSNNTASDEITMLSQTDISKDATNEVLSKLNIEDDPLLNQIQKIKSTQSKLAQVKNGDNASIIDGNQQKLSEVKDEILERAGKTDDIASISFGALQQEEIYALIGAKDENDKGKLKAIDKAITKLNKLKTDGNATTVDSNIKILNEMKQAFDSASDSTSNAEKWASVDFGSLSKGEFFETIGSDENNSSSEKIKALNNAKRELEALQNKDTNPQIQTNIDVVDQYLSELNLAADNSDLYENEERSSAIENVEQKDFSTEDKAAIKSAIAQSELKETNEQLEDGNLTKEEREALTLKKMQLENTIAEQNQIIASTNEDKAKKIEADQDFQDAISENDIAPETDSFIKENQKDIEKIEKSNDKIAEYRVDQANDDAENSEKWEKKINKEEQKKLSKEEEVVASLIKAQDEDVVNALSQNDALQAKLSTQTSLQNTDTYQKALAQKQNALEDLDKVDELIEAANNEDNPQKRVTLLKEASVLQQKALKNIQKSNNALEQLSELQPEASTNNAVVANEKSNEELSEDMAKQIEQLEEKENAYRDRAAALRDSSENVKKKYQSAILIEADKYDSLANEIASQKDKLEQQQKSVAQKANLEKSIKENQSAGNEENVTGEDIASDAYKDYFDKQEKIQQERDELDQVRDDRKNAEQNAKKKIQAATVVYEQMENTDDPDEKASLEKQYNDLKNEARTAQEEANALRQKENDLEAQVLKDELDAQITLKEEMGDKADDILAMKTLKQPEEIATNNTNNQNIDATYKAPEVVDRNYFELNDGASPYSNSNPIPVDEKQPSGVVYKVQIGAFRSEISPDQFNEFKPLSGESIGNGITRYLVGYFAEFEAADDAKAQIRTKGYPDAFVVAYKDGKRISISEARGQENAVVANNTNTNNQNNTSTQENNSTNDNNTTTNDNNSNSNVAENNTNDNNTSNGNTTTNDNNSTNVQPQTNADGTVKANEVDKMQGLFYTVQIGVYSTPVKPAQLFNIVPINSERTESGYIRYTTGIFNSVETASTRKDEVRNKGVSDAFVTAYYNGKRITIAESRNLLAENGNSILYSGEGSSTTNDNVENNETETDTATTQEPNELDQYMKEAVYYRVKIGSYKQKVPSKLANYLLVNEDDYLFVETDDDSITSYYTDRINSYEEANQVYRKIKSEGMDKSEITAFYKYESISVEKARAIQNHTPQSTDTEEDLSGYVKEGVYFKVFLGKFAEGIPANVALLLVGSEDENLYIESEMDIFGATSIYIGKSENYSKVLDYEQELADQGFDTEIKAFYKYDEIPLDKALKILSSDDE